MDDVLEYLTGMRIHDWRMAMDVSEMVRAYLPKEPPKASFPESVDAAIIEMW